MLYIYENKIYIKPVEYKLVEVKVEKEGEGYDVKAVGKPIELAHEELRNVRDVSIEEAYEMQHKASSSKKKSFLD